MPLGNRQILQGLPPHQASVIFSVLLPWPRSGNVTSGSSISFPFPRASCCPSVRAHRFPTPLSLFLLLDRYGGNLEEVREQMKAGTWLCPHCYEDEHPEEVRVEAPRIRIPPL